MSGVGNMVAKLPKIEQENMQWQMSISSLPTHRRVRFDEYPALGMFVPIHGRMMKIEDND